jgi:hypothetical protein
MYCLNWPVVNYRRSLRFGRVETWRGGRRLDRNCSRPFRLAVPQLISHGRVSTSPSSNRTGTSRARLSDRNSHRPQGAPACNAARRSCRFPNPLCFATSCVVPELRPLPSAGVTRFHRYYKPLRHFTGPSLSLAGVRLAPSRPRGEASRVAMTFPLYACCHHCPGGLPGCGFRSLPQEMAAFPMLRVGRLRIRVFEACSMFTAGCSLRTR